MKDNMPNVDKWWSSLSVAQKERIAVKANNGEPVGYPACSYWWNGLNEERKLEIKSHCIYKHGYLVLDWQEGSSMSY